MDLHEALYTTRAMRRMHPDPVPWEVEARILDAAIRAPTGGNAQQWRFVVVDDAGLKAELGPWYRANLRWAWDEIYRDRMAAARATPEDADHAALLRMYRSVSHLADHVEQTPLWLFAFSRDRTGGSIFPAVWNAMLAARADGVGSALTTLFNRSEQDVAELLGMPPDGGWRLACAVAMGYPTGRWGIAARRPAHEVASRNGWDKPLGYRVDRPLWTGRPDA